MRLATFTHAMSSTNATAAKEEQEDRADRTDDLVLQGDHACADALVLSG
jgi:hypothetical protein